MWSCSGAVTWSDVDFSSCLSLKLAEWKIKKCDSLDFLNDFIIIVISLVFLSFVIFCLFFCCAVSLPYLCFFHILMLLAHVWVTSASLSPSRSSFIYLKCTKNLLCSIRLLRKFITIQCLVSGAMPSKVCTCTCPCGLYPLEIISHFNDMCKNSTF